MQYLLLIYENEKRFEKGFDPKEIAEYAAFGKEFGGALKGGITFKDGHTEQTNFDKYSVARMMDAPASIFVHLVESDEKPTGVGEPPVPPFAPALANALFAATGKRYRDLPIKLG